MATIEEAATKNNWREEAGTVSWFALEPAEITSRLGVDPASGLSGSEAASRLASVGPNRFPETAVEPRWRAFVRQYRDPMQIVLLVAGIGSLYPLKELRPGLVLLFMNTNVTRGAGTFAVTSTGMATEVGHISHMLQATGDADTPLTLQLKKLTNQILFIAGAAVAVSVILNLSRGESFDTVFTVAIAFAI